MAAGNGSEPNAIICALNPFLCVQKVQPCFRLDLPIVPILGAYLVGRVLHGRPRPTRRLRADVIFVKNSLRQNHGRSPEQDMNATVELANNPAASDTTPTHLCSFFHFRNLIGDLSLQHHGFYDGSSGAKAHSDGDHYCFG